MKYIRKIHALLFVLGMTMFIVFSSVVLAQNDETIFTVNDVKGTAGEQIAVFVGISNITQELTSIDLTIQFDDTKLEFVSAEDTKIFDEYNGMNLIGKGYMSFSWGSGLNRISTAASGNIVKLNFKISEEFVSGNTKIEVKLLDAYDYDLNEIEIGECVGKIAVEVPAHNHIWNNWIETKTAACTEDGSKERNCTVKGCQEKETQTIPKTGHLYNGSQQEIKEATCIEDGTLRTYCSNTGCTEYEDTVIAKKGHVEGDWTEVKAATCTETGTREKRCTTCQEKIAEESISKLGHAYNGKREEIKEATCTEDGTLRAYCSNIGCTEYEDTVITKKGHIEGEWIEVKQATCTEIGTKEKRCTTCQEKIAEESISKLGHAYNGKQEEIKEATCTEDGTLRTCCSNIGCTEYEDTVITKKGHVEGEWVEVKESTCSETGIREKRCTTCQEQVTEESIPVLDHIYNGKQEEIKEATCTENGTLRTYCSNAGCIEYEDMVIVKKEHTWSQWIVVQKPYADVEGLQERKCIVCNSKEQKKIEAIKEDVEIKVEDEMKKAPKTEDNTYVYEMIFMFASAVCLWFITWGKKKVFR